MADTPSEVRIELARLDERVKAMEEESLHRAVADLRVTVGEIKSRLTITYGLLLLILGGLVSLAFSVWGGGAP